jgi:hypothetical protein
MSDWLDDFQPSSNSLFELAGTDDILDGYISGLMTPGLTEEQRQDIFDEMAEYLDWEYDIDLNAVWDWEDYRANYDAA